MNASTAPIISIIVTCKDRLHHLKQTLPSLANQSHSELIVVDYGCTSGTSKYVSANYPHAKVVLVDDDPLFKISRARNLGAKYANGNILFFTDADIVINADLGKWIEEHALEDSYYIAELPCHSNLRGTVVCSRANFQTLGGYDEAFSGWGGEDTDLYMRLEHAGIQRRFFSSSFITPIHHSDLERCIALEKGGMGSERSCRMVSELYISIKKDLLNLGAKNLSHSKRLSIMNEVRGLVHDLEVTKQEQVIKINLDEIDFKSDLNSHRELVYRIKPR